MRPPPMKAIEKKASGRSRGSASASRRRSPRRTSPRSPVANSGASASGANLASVARASRTPRLIGEAKSDQRPDEQRRDQRVVGVRLQGVVRERVGGPGEAEDDAEAGPAEPAPEHEEPGDCRQVEDDRGGMRRREVVPGAVPGQDELERDVCEVVEGAVGVAEGIVGGERVRPQTVWPWVMWSAPITPA